MSEISKSFVCNEARAMRLSVLRILLLVALCGTVARSVSIPLSREPHLLHKSYADVPTFRNKYRTPAGTPAGSSIPMSVWSYHRMIATEI